MNGQWNVAAVLEKIGGPNERSQPKKRGENLLVPVLAKPPGRARLHHPRQ